MVKRSFDVYHISNYGTLHAFNPHKKIIDQYTNTERTLLAVHVDKVLEANDPELVFIVDADGYRLNIAGPL